MKLGFRRSRRHHAPLVVTLYTRAGCHLCDEARKPVARAVAATAGATLRVIDIAAQPEDEARYGERIPVVTALVRGEEQVVAELKVSDLWLRRALSALAREP